MSCSTMLKAIEKSIKANTVISAASIPDFTWPLTLRSVVIVSSGSRAMLRPESGLQKTNKAVTVNEIGDTQASRTDKKRRKGIG